MAGTSLQAGPIFAGGELTFQGTAQVTDTSRVSPNAESPSDIFYTFTPAVTYERETAAMNLRANLALPFRRYDENTQYDSDDIEFLINGEVPFGAGGPRLSGDWSVAYIDGMRASYLTNQVLNTESLNANAYVDYVLRNKLSLRTRFGYNDRSSSGVEEAYQNANTSTLFAAGIHARELIRGRIGLYAEYLIRSRKTDRGATAQAVDNTDDGINFGITGQILPENLFPKLEADLAFGLTSTDVGNYSNTTSSQRNNRLTLDGRLAYPANTKTNVALTYRRNLAVTDDDRTVEQSDLSLMIDYTPNQKLTFVTEFGVQSNDFIFDQEPRNDDVFIASVSANYTIRLNWFATIGYNYRDSSSTVEISDYNSSTFNLSTTLAF